MHQVCFTRQLRGVWAPLAVLRWDSYKFTIFSPIVNWFAWLRFCLISDRFEGRQTGFSKCLLENSQVEALQFRVWKKTNTWVRECFNWFSFVGTILLNKPLYAPTAVRISFLSVFYLTFCFRLQDWEVTATTFVWNISPSFLRFQKHLTFVLSEIHLFVIGPITNKWM